MFSAHSPASQLTKDRRSREQNMTLVVKSAAFLFLHQVCEQLGAAPENSWSLFLLGAQSSQKLEVTETSDAFSPAPHPGSEIHSTFIHTLQDNMSTDGIERARKSNYQFVDTVQTLLCATRPLMYS